LRKLDISIGQKQTDGLVYIGHILGNAQIEVRNSLGQIVSVCSQVIDRKSIQIDMSGVPVGSYFLSVGNSKAFKTYKLVVQ